MIGHLATSDNGKVCCKADRQQQVAARRKAATRFYLDQARLPEPAG